MTTEKIEKLMNTIGQKAKSSANSLAYSDPENFTAPSTFANIVW